MTKLANDIQFSRRVSFYIHRGKRGIKREKETKLWQRRNRKRVVGFLVNGAAKCKGVSVIAIAAKLQELSCSLSNNLSSVLSEF